MGHHSSRSGRRWRPLDDIPAGSVQNARARLTFSLRTKDADVLVLSAGFDALLPWLLVALALAIAFALWRLRLRAMQRAARRRTAGYQLMDALKAYTVWIDWHRDEPLLHQNPEELSIPAVLKQAVQIKDEHFPELSRLMVQLLQTHRELMQYLWEENILRLTHQGALLRPHYADPRYHQLRDTQDAALDSLFLRCRQLIGEAESEWTRTRSDFSFSSGPGVTSTPSST